MPHAFFGKHSLSLIGAAYIMSGCNGLIGSDSSDKAAAATLTCTEDRPSPGPAPLRRLTPLEYANTVEQIFGVDVEDQLGELPVDGSFEGFDNNAQSLTISRDHVDGFLTIAEHVATSVAESQSLRNAVLGECDPITDTCLAGVIQSLGRQLFRQAIDDQEITALQALLTHADANDPYDKLKLAIIGLLQSPRFLFRPEVGVSNDAERPDLLRLTGYEIATRLAFLLWQTGPDGALLDEAAAGELDTAESVATRAEQMLTDERAAKALQTFSHQWLSVETLKDITIADPDFNETLLRAAHEEMSLLVNDYFKPDTDLMGLFSSPLTYLNDTLGTFYGVEVSGAEHQKWIWDDASARRGLFGTAGFLMITGEKSENTVVHRGKFIREVLLCNAPPLPPPDVEAEAPQPGENPLDVVNARASDPFCGSCHKSMDGIGLGLERYSRIGALRTEYETEGNTYPLPESGEFFELHSDQEGSVFNGATELGELVSQSAVANRCALESYFRWALGRSLHEADSCALDAFEQSFNEKGRSIRSWLIEFVKSTSFRYRIPVQE